MSTLRLSPLQHFVSLFAALFIAATLFTGAAVNAQTRTNGPTYRAELVQPASATRIITGTVLWSCTGTTCTAARATSRPAIVCARFVREVGAVASFAVNGTAMAAEDLARCNAAAN